jgi:hypothetical protein
VSLKHRPSSAVPRQHMENIMTLFLHQLTLSLWVETSLIQFSIPKILLAMADGLSVAASVVGIATAAIQSVQFLSRTIDNIEGVPDTTSKSTRRWNPSYVNLIHNFVRRVRNKTSVEFECGCCASDNACTRLRAKPRQ